MKNSNEMTVKEFRALPYLAELPKDKKIRTLIVLPGTARKSDLHDSGYRRMEFVLVGDEGPFGRISGCSDVIHIEGIGGMGYDWLNKYGTCPRLVPPTGWSVDCLAKSGLLQFFPSNDMCDGILVDPMCLSSFEVFGNLKAGRG